ARCHVALGDFGAAQATYDRALGLCARTVERSIQLLSVYSVKQDLLIALNTGWGEMRQDEDAKMILSHPTNETRFAFAGINSTAAYVFAQLGQPETALQWLAT